MRCLIICAIVLVNKVYSFPKESESSETKDVTNPFDDSFDNNVIDFDDEYSVKFSEKYGLVPWHGNNFSKESHKYTVVNKAETVKLEGIEKTNDTKKIEIGEGAAGEKAEESTTTTDYSVIPLELLSTTDNNESIETTTEVDLTVIPLTTPRDVTVEFDKDFTIENVTMPATTSTDTTTENSNNSTVETTTTTDTTTENSNNSTEETTEYVMDLNNATVKMAYKENLTASVGIEKPTNGSVIDEALKTNSTDTVIVTKKSDETSEEDDISIFTELDVNDSSEVPEDYYDSKDVVPTKPPNNDALSVIFGLAGSVVESVAEKVVPKSIFDLFKRIQKQNEALEAEKLRSREENGGLGQFGRGILKSISSGLSKPLSQLMAGARDNGSLDSDRSFVSSLASSVTSVASVATSVLDTFKDKVQAIYPGTVWCGDGHSATARSGSELGLFFFTDTCCRQHDACKLYIRAGETKYGLTNTGLFTRSHCSCDQRFRECLHSTNSLVSAQIGLTYFNVLGPQCFRKAHPIVRCIRRTRLTGQKCEEYEMDYTKPKMWQWFDSETF